MSKPLPGPVHELPNGDSWVVEDSPTNAEVLMTYSKGRNRLYCWGCSSETCLHTQAVACYIELEEASNA